MPGQDKRWLVKTKDAQDKPAILLMFGRAICRIVSAHNWSLTHIARIFDVHHSCIKKALENGYTPPDVVSEDYTRLDDPEFSKHFPPGAVAQLQPCERSEPPLKTTEDDSSDDEWRPSSSRGPLKRKGEEHESSLSPLSARTAKKPRHFSSSSTPSAQGTVLYSSPTSTFIPPLPRRKLRSPADTYPLSSSSIPPTLSAFLKSVNKIDLSTHLSFLLARGFTLERIRIMGETWTDEMIKEAVERGLCKAEEAEERKTLSIFDALTLELAIRKFRHPAGSPPSQNSSTTPASLSAFLSNLVGFDLTTHRALFEGQGFDIARLSAIREWEEGDLREVLGRALQPSEKGAGGVSKLEVMAVEFALRNCANCKAKQKGRATSDPGSTPARGLPQQFRDGFYSGWDNPGAHRQPFECGRRESSLADEATSTWSSSHPIFVTNIKLEQSTPPVKTREKSNLQETHS
ncbi:hypothetical protein FB45DRAFT_1001629 [Roridomyces roridus]|uniref:Uncharacterized protein n=1 Tax=Roridomyces roridus TaxID=1738132 RepID=A0AAD7FTF9_9AGAR|nr:hypothetical protein FB45DRAFT_1001629 [Roridomyces roridus]